MTADEFTRKKHLLHSFEALARNHAFTTELEPLFRKHFDNALTGLRSRESREARAEYLQAADDAEALTKFVGMRIEQLRAELAVEPEAAMDGSEE